MPEEKDKHNPPPASEPSPSDLIESTQEAIEKIRQKIPDLRKPPEEKPKSRHATA